MVSLVSTGNQRTSMGIDLAILQCIGEDGPALRVSRASQFNDLSAPTWLCGRKPSLLHRQRSHLLMHVGLMCSMSMLAFALEGSRTSTDPNEGSEVMCAPNLILQPVATMQWACLRQPLGNALGHIGPPHNLARNDNWSPFLAVAIGARCNAQCERGRVEWSGANSEAIDPKQDREGKKHGIFVATCPHAFRAKIHRRRVSYHWLSMPDHGLNSPSGCLVEDLCCASAMAQNWHKQWCKIDFRACHSARWLTAAIMLSRAAFAMHDKPYGLAHFLASNGTTSESTGATCLEQPSLSHKRLLAHARSVNVNRYSPRRFGGVIALLSPALAFSRILVVCTFGLAIYRCEALRRQCLCKIGPLCPRR